MHHATIYFQLLSLAKNLLPLTAFIEMADIYCKDHLRLKQQSSTGSTPCVLQSTWSAATLIETQRIFMG
jgi:hypothetical protein